MNVPLIYCDHNEERSGLPQRLAENGCAVEIECLDVGDYLLSSGLGVERKSAGDLVDSISSQRLLGQLDRLAYTHGHAVLLMEGDSWEGNRKFKTPMLAAVYHHVLLRPDFDIIYSPSLARSALILEDLARREQTGGSLPPLPRPSARRARGPADVLESLPEVGASGAAKLIKAFGSVRAVATASEPQLQAVLGPKRGKEVYALLTRAA